jgi:hypothetical protein
VDSGGPPHPRPVRMLRVGFVHVKTLAVRNNPISKLYQLFRTRGHPYGLQDSLSTLRLSCSPCDSSTDARLDTGRWLSLARRGLSPRKIRQASPGAITVKAEKPRPASVASGSEDLPQAPCYAVLPPNVLRTNGCTNQMPTGKQQSRINRLRILGNVGVLSLLQGCKLFNSEP